MIRSVKPLETLCNFPGSPPYIPDLIILNMVEYNFSDRISKSYSMGDDMFELKRISPWFAQIAWDNLIFVINPGSRMMYVIAFTDMD